MKKYPVRLAPLAEREWNEEQRTLLAPAAAGKGLGRGVLNIFATLVRHPKLYKRWSVFGTHTLLKSSLPARTRELVILRAAWLSASRYEWGQHLSIGREAGLDDVEMERIKAGAEAPGWAPADALVLRAVDELKRDSVLGDATWTALAETLCERQLMDLVFTVGQYCMLAMALNTFGVPLDPHFEAAEQAHLD